MKNADKNENSPDDHPQSARQARDLTCIRRGDFDRLIASYVPDIEAWARKGGMVGGEIYEVVQYVCIRAWKEFEAGKSFVGVSVHGSMRQKASWGCGEVRKRRGGDGKSDVTDVDDIDRDEAFATMDDYSAVMEDEGWAEAALAELPDRQRDVLTLIFLEDKTVAEIAAILGIKANAVSQAKFQGLRTLALILGA